MLIEPEALQSALASARGDANPDASFAAPGDGELDLASLLEDDAPPEDLTILSLDEPVGSARSAPRDLDAEMRGSATATRIALDDEKPEDAIDDLFVELIEE